MRQVFAAVLAGLFVSVAGCGGSGPKMREVTGTVTFEGKDVTEGDIIFAPIDKAIGPEGGKIKDGKYTMKVKEGKNAVKITAVRTVPGKKGSMGEDFIEQYIPEKYNEKTTLTVDVGSDQAKHDFDLKK